MENELLKDRSQAGLLLSKKLNKYKHTNTIILAVPRGGVPVGNSLAKNLHLPLDIILSKKIGHPYNKEFAIGAVSQDSIIIDHDNKIPQKYIDAEIIRLQEVLRGKYEYYRGTQKPLDIEDKNVILVDDGIATGNTLLASIAMLRKKNPAQIIVAVPVLPYEMVSVFKKNADELVYLIASKDFSGVGSFYKLFDQVEDEEVIQILNTSNSTV